MFEMLASLVHEQAEMLDNVEHNMNDAKQYIDKGEKNIELAKKWYQQTRCVRNITIRN
jgi:t-SNARE complex subunit (syntaxin)